ncbi:MAG: CoA-binding protein [Deltaproteobacteria bacterium]|nr:CoA-binding protein [Deltaproteobacteria bacterium]
MPIQQDEALRRLLESVRTIAVVGIKAGVSDDAYRVPAYMQRQGYEILPVSPKLDSVLDEGCVANLSALPETPDLVNLFRAAGHMPAHVDEILALDPLPRAVWMQLGIRHTEAAERLEAAGIEVIQDRCLMVDHGRLLGAAPPLRIPLHYDFASTVCYVAHRVLARMAPTLRELGLELAWTPVDLTAITGYARGMEMPETSRANARRIGTDLGVAVEPPPHWMDSRPAAAAALLAARTGRVGAEETWRERIWTALFEERRNAPNATEVITWAHQLGFTIDPAALERAIDELDELTRQAREDQVTGVPTFMLGRWPFGGIQTEETMANVLERYARKSRSGELS